MSEETPMKQKTKDVSLILFYALLIIVSGVIIALVSTGDIPIFAIICPIFILIVVPWFLIVRYSRSKNPSNQEEFPQGKLSLDAYNRWNDKQLKHLFRFGILPIIIAIIIVIIFAIAVAVTS